MLNLTKWHELGLYGLLLVSISRLMGNYNGELIGFTLVFCMLGYLLTQRLLLRSHQQTERSLWMVIINELTFMLQGLLFLLVVVAGSSLVINHDLNGLFATKIQPALTFFSATVIGHHGFDNLFFNLWPVWAYFKFYLLWGLVALIFARPRLQKTLTAAMITLAGSASVAGLFWAIRCALTAPNRLATAFFLLPFALGSLLAIGFTQRRQQTSFEAQVVKPKTLTIGLLLVLLSTGLLLGSVQSPIWRIVVLVITSFLSAGIVYALNKALQTLDQPRPNFFRVVSLAYLLFWPLKILIQPQSILNWVLVVILTVGLTGLDLWLFKQLDRLRTRFQVPPRRQTQGLLLLSTILITILGSFSIYQANTLGDFRQAKANAATKVTSKTTKAAPTVSQTMLQGAWEKIGLTSHEKISVAVYSLKTKQLVTYSNQPATTSYVGASTVKVGVLVQILHLRDQGKLTLTATDKANLAKMIEESDNDATDALLADALAGNQALNQLYQNLDMQHSQADLSHWGLTKTTATDQIKLLQTIFGESTYLSTKSKQYAKSLLDNVETDQAWGISKGATSYAVKNGWLNADDQGHWAVNSIGQVVTTKTGTDGALMAIYTNNDPSMASGIQLVEQLAAVANDKFTVK
ncbi:serine hydrolase [Lactiplantibacillus sp. WILCCON 0030]|uniref:Serine hydrolase n=1 Tax=Lactiplantibacillus brownii TaxID=3069269 RepID=A0ABU1AAM3_9LACO|nr:serine hydrolase [Lactiplantibacillus brownii]MDQ7938004.1 serine hydrolase [Lactiplantibacillus brownii]